MVDFDDFGIVEVRCIFFDDGLDEGRIDVLIKFEGVIIVIFF